MYRTSSGVRRFVVLLVLVVVACVGCSSGSSPGPVPSRDPSPTKDATAETALPDGWRWESYRGVEVAVPGDWGADNASQRIGQWCVDGGGKEPAIGRPGGSTLVGCPGGDQVDETLVANTGPIVAFADAVYSDGTDNQVPRGGDREVVRVGDVYVIVQVAQPLRDQIVATVRQADVDANDCPSTDAVTRDPSARPDAPVDVASLRGIQSVSACRYALRTGVDGQPRPGPTLMSSTRVTGRDALRLVRRIAGAPEGSGPNSPGNCLKEVSYGEEIVVLRITSAARVSTVHVRYSGCDHHGFDDGTVVRRLVREPLDTILSDANAVGEWDGDVFVELFGGAVTR